MRLILALLLATLTAPARGDWVKYGESDNAAYYYDPATITKNGDFARVWQFQDFKRRAADGSRSARLLSEYDCKGSQYRILDWSTHSQEMLRGEKLDSGDEAGKWIDIVPGTSPAAVLEDLCRIERASRSGEIEGAGAGTPQKNVQFAVQVGAFADPDRVKALTARLAAAKMRYYTELVTTAKGPLTRVRVGPFADRAAAEKAVETLKGMGLKPGAVFARR